MIRLDVDLLYLYIILHILLLLLVLLSYQATMSILYMCCVARLCWCHRHDVCPAAPECSFIVLCVYFLNYIYYFPLLFMNTSLCLLCVLLPCPTATENRISLREHPLRINKVLSYYILSYLKLDLMFINCPLNFAFIFYYLCF